MTGFIILGKLTGWSGSNVGDWEALQGSEQKDTFHQIKIANEIKHVISFQKQIMDLLFKLVVLQIGKDLKQFHTNNKLRFNIQLTQKGIVK